MTPTAPMLGPTGLTSEPSPPRPRGVIAMALEVAQLWELKPGVALTLCLGFTGF